jgi:hypothetical protein
VKNAAWDSATSTWTVTAERKDTGGLASFTCNFLFMCAGYYSYRAGFIPDFPGIETFKGKIVHPQKWPEDLDYAHKSVVVVGSGATAMTLVPAMAPHPGDAPPAHERPGYAGPPWVDDFSAGYMQREMHRFPRQGDRDPWINPQDYKRDKQMIRRGAVEDGPSSSKKPSGSSNASPCSRRRSSDACPSPIT